MARDAAEIESIRSEPNHTKRAYLFAAFFSLQFLVQFLQFLHDVVVTLRPDLCNAFLTRRTQFGSLGAARLGATSRRPFVVLVVIVVGVIRVDVTVDDAINSEPV